jgi:hypothetical protein
LSRQSKPIKVVHIAQLLLEGKRALEPDAVPS